MDKDTKKDEPRFPSNIPVVEPEKASGVAGSIRPAIKDYKGKYTRASDGEVYALAVVESDPLGRTHKAMNSAHSWEGTERQFAIAFTEVGKEGEAKKLPDLERNFAAREKARKEDKKA